ncbi:Mannosylfructose-phosphate synthase [Methylobrevis pamukkalensis]|uniref:Mannosylfructose-phosphate synthase n=1 Tax=Methylobrevis pamukkalensis TaxID=1439726 RepID=A0A1E3H3Y4_9HYPH|nr:Mannosylfructose-phosphate synthase [Methylobrevis pamukkalensis]
MSRLWQRHLATALGLAAVRIGNGVDRSVFRPARDASDDELAATLLPPGGPVFLSVGGVEERKNTVRILEAFRIVHASQPDARLVIAGGASLLDHARYKAAFDAILAGAGLPDGAVLLTGPLPQHLLPPLYRAATALVFPSLKEGFGLVVIEAMACGTPVVVSEIAPFTEYLAPDEALWCDPHAPERIAMAMARALNPAARIGLARHGLAVAARHDWVAVAGAHLPVYSELMESCHA